MSNTKKNPNVYTKATNFPEGFAWWLDLDQPTEEGKLRITVAIKDEGEAGQWLDEAEQKLIVLGKREFPDEEFKLPLKRGEACKLPGYATVELKTDAKRGVEIFGYNPNGELVEVKAGSVEKGSRVIARGLFGTYDFRGKKGISTYLNSVCVLETTPDKGFLLATDNTRDPDGDRKYFASNRPPAEGKPVSVIPEDNDPIGPAGAPSF